MSSYSPFLGEKSMNSSFEDRLGLQQSCYAPPLTPSVASTPSSSSVGGFQHSLFTPPQVVTESSSLHSLLQIAMQQSPPPFKLPSEADYTAAAASLLSCLSSSSGGNSQNQVRRAKTNNGSFDWLRGGASSSLSRQVSTDSSPGGNPIIQALVNSPNQLTASSVQGKVMDLATDRNGSRLLQKLLTQGGLEIVARVIDEVEFNLPIIMCDTYANYMCQQLFQAASARQRFRLLSRLAPRFVEVARDRRGTHSLQALISHISSVEEEDLLASILQGQIESIALDVHATHVLQQAISCCLAKPGGHGRKLDFVFAEVVNSMPRLAVDPNALGVVKRCITHSQARGYAPLIAKKIDCCMFDFVENPYANYAVQHALETWSASTDPSIVALAEALVLKLSDKIAPMSLHKFASNVAEMAIKSSNPRLRYTLIEALQYEDDSRMLSLMRSPFGVFVVGTAIKFADQVNQSHALTMAICKNLKKLPDGRNKTKWEKLLAECAYSHQFFSALAASVSAASTNPPPTPSTCSDSASVTSSRG